MQNASDIGPILDAGKQAYQYLIFAADILAVLVLAIYGFKYITTTDSRARASLKEKAWIYLVGFLIIYSAPWIFNTVVKTLVDTIYMVPTQ
jgi:hypothetical protein